MTKNKNKLCSFCNFDKQTEFYYHDKWKNIIICRDKNNLGFKYRILAVRTGPKNHKSLPTGEEREELLTPLIAVVEAQVKNGKAIGYELDEVARFVTSHYHYQMNMS